MRRLLGGLFVAAALNIAHASEVVSGVGNMPCGTYLKMRNSDWTQTTDIALGSWLQGFLSGTNIKRVQVSQTPESLKPLPDVHSILAYVDGFCRENPLDKVLGGALRLDEEIETR